MSGTPMASHVSTYRPLLRPNVTGAELAPSYALEHAEGASALVRALAPSVPITQVRTESNDRLWLDSYSQGCWFESNRRSCFARSVVVR